MIKDIPYTGYSAQPSDYESADGELAHSLNLIHEDGRMRPVAPPSVAFSLASNESILLIHIVPAAKHYIIGRHTAGGNIDILWLPKSSTAPDTASATYITTVKDIKDIEAIGNTLAVAVPDAVEYLLWKGGRYIAMGARPPFVNIDFANNFVDEASGAWAGTLPGSLNTLSGEWVYDWPKVSQIVYGILNPAVMDRIAKRGYFFQPFFVRYAYRLYDGSYSWHSAPILMLPSAQPPIIEHEYVDSSDPGVTEKISFFTPYFSLQYRILASGLDKLKDWEDIVAGIDIFVSAPIYLYDQSKDVRGIRPQNEVLSSIYHLARQDYWDVTTLPMDTSSLETPAEIFSGHYGGRQPYDKIFYDRYMSLSSEIRMVDLPLTKEFHEKIKSTHTFYKLAKIDFAQIKAMDALKDITHIDRDLSTLISRETLPDDNRSHCGLSASSLYSFNSRLNIAGATLKPAQPFSLRSCTEFNNPFTSAMAQFATITVWTVINGQKCKSVRKVTTGDEAEWVYGAETNFPRYIFYPDSAAYKMEIAYSDTKKFIIDLKPHDHLTGAYYYCGHFKNDTTPVNAEPESHDVPTVADVSSKVYTSEVNNPFVFPMTGTNSVGSGSIKKICSAAKALSEGQFGQFPLYAFTDEGVWALEVSAEGTYSAKQPITRDVCINPDGITQIDSAVLFPTQRGIMLLSGSKAECISDTINSAYPFVPDDIPGFQTLHSMLHYPDSGTPASDGCLTILPFADFLSGCRMVYDYSNQRLVVYNPKQTYAYLYSFKSKRWGMMLSRVQSNFNSYPDALAVDDDNNVVDFSHPAVSTVPVLLVSRPLKLDAPNVLKTIDTVIQRGDFRRGHVKSALYGSRDLEHWHPVWSSTDHEMRGFSGTPYKWFRIVLVGNLGVGESIFGASVQFDHKYIDRLR